MRTIFVLMAVVIATFGITRYETLRVTIGKTEQLIKANQMEIAAGTQEHLKAEDVQKRLSKMAQNVYFSYGLFQWRTGVILSCVIALALFVAAFSLEKKVKCSSSKNIKIPHCFEWLLPLSSIVVLPLYLFFEWPAARFIFYFGSFVFFFSIYFGVSNHKQFKNSVFPIVAFIGHLLCSI